MLLIMCIGSRVQHCSTCSTIHIIKNTKHYITCTVLQYCTHYLEHETLHLHVLYYNSVHVNLYTLSRTRNITLHGSRVQHCSTVHVM